MKGGPKGQIQQQFFTILAQTTPVVVSVCSKKGFKTLPNSDSTIHLLVFPSWVILLIFIIYLRYFQVNDQYEEMRVLSS